MLLWAAAGFAQTRPDLSGIWGGDAAHAANLGTPAMTPAGEKLFKEHQNGKGDPQKRCLPAGVPRRDARPFKIVQKPDLIVILEEGDIHTFRQIFTDGSDHPADLDPTWYGDSRGRWEGKELVVDTVGFNGLTWLDAAGHPASKKLHVIERISRPDQGHLSTRITIEDPEVYSKPWSVTIVSPLLTNVEIREYACKPNFK